MKKGGISVVFSCLDNNFKYLHIRTETLAFRIPSTKNKRGRALKNILKQIGPLVAPSVNFEGERPAQTLTEVKNIFKNLIDFYLSESKRLNCKPSTLVSFQDGEMKILRGKLILKNLKY